MERRDDRHPPLCLVSDEPKHEVVFKRRRFAYAPDRIEVLASWEKTWIFTGVARQLWPSITGKSATIAAALSVLK
jgi:hypothetical protein